MPTETLSGWIHILILMDEAVLFSTTRNGIKTKVAVLQGFCNDYIMKVNSANM